ncbi:MAG: GNAT family N-acetyltransferase [Flavobacteriaceae bacterium]
MEVAIRFAHQNDIPAILEIVNHEIKHSTALYDYNERNLETQIQWFNSKCETGFPVIVAHIEGVLMGFGSYGLFRPWDAYRFSVEHSIYIHQKAQGKGVGTQLLTALINLAKKEGYHTMIAGIDALNKGSIGFHKKFGFVEVGTIKAAGFKFDTWLDLTFLQLMLK